MESSKRSQLRNAIEELFTDFDAHKKEIVKLNKQIAYLTSIAPECCEICNGQGFCDPGYHNVGAPECTACKGTGCAK